MPDIAGTSSLRHNDPTTTLTSIGESFKSGGDNQHIRFSDAKGLHTHSKWGASNMDFLAFFRNPKALQQRAEMRSGGAEVIKQAIDNEYGKGIGQKVFDQLHVGGRDGITVGDLKQMHVVAGQILQNELDVLRDRVGALDIYEYVGECHENLGMFSGRNYHKNYEPDELDTLLGKMAAAVNPMRDRTATECARVGTGEVIKYNLLKSNEKSGHSFNEAQLAQFEQLMDSCFHPDGANVGFRPETVYMVMSGYCSRGELPTPEQFAEQLATRSMIR